MAETAQDNSSPIGSVLLGRYRLVRELAKGGMGVVYLARAEGAVGFVKPVVVKLVLPEHAGDKRFLGMFAREAQILAHLRHPSIVDVIEFGEQDGAYVMVLEYVRGYHLGQWAKFLRLKGREVPVEIAMQLVIDVLDALHHAHSMEHHDGSSMHIVHRDVSPSNILLDEDGRARLLDFGVARMRGGNSDYQTMVKGFVGKLMYSAPEIFAEGESTPSSDVYACAVVLHEMLLGKNPFRGENQAKTLNRVLHHLPESVELARSDAPRGLDKVLNRALAKSPEGRFDNARDFAAALRALQPESENEVRAQLSALLKIDFGREMAELLGLESLADRDEAWRRLSPRTPTSETVLTIEASGVEYKEQTEQGNLSSTVGSSNRSWGRPNPPSLAPNTVPPTVGPVTTASGRKNSPLPVIEKRRAPPPPPPTATGGFKAVDGNSANAGRSHAAPHLVWGVVALSALALIAWIANGVLTARAPVVNAPPIRVVSSPTPAPAAPAEPAVPSRPAAAEPERTSAVEAPSAPPEKPEKPEKHRTSAQLLTRAFRKQQPQVEACFAQHALQVQGMPTLQVEFDLSAQGQLNAVRVLPKALADTALGRCIHKVSSATQFPAQGKPISFAIPLSASRGG